MRLRRVPGAREYVTENDLVLQEHDAPLHRGQWRKLFGNENELRLEIGMGRGRFIAECALAEPQVDFLGLELREEMVMDAISRLKQPLPNLRFLQLNANLLPELFADGEIDRIYINFPDPWPKSRHEKRRLTAPRYLEVYRRILAPQGEIRFKTDNRELFDWSLESFAAGGLELAEVEFDLAAEHAGVMTEYERRFRKQGQPICYAMLISPGWVE